MGLVVVAAAELQMIDLVVDPIPSTQLFEVVG